MQKNNLSVEVLVRGRPVKEFYHEDGNTYIEGRKNSPFELRIRNNNFSRVLVIPSVDGLSVMDGKKADSDSNGYIVNGFSSLTIPGWRLDNSEVAKFFFQEEKGKGYAAQVGEEGNEGVIGFMFFEEKALPNWTTVIIKEIEKQPVWPYDPWHPWNPWKPYGPYWTGGYYTNTIGSAGGGNAGGVGGAGSAGSPNLQNMSFTSGAGVVGNAESVKCSFSADVQPDISVNVCQTMDAAPAEVEEHVSVGFGEAMDHAVNTVSFDRGDHLETFAIYYDTRKGLEQRGIDVVKPTPRPTPNPFPGDQGCTPPPNWVKS